MFSETHLGPENFILPVFIHEDSKEKVPITSMPGVFRQPWKTGLVEMVEEARALGINNIILFPKVPDHLKTNLAEEAYNPDGIVHRSIRLLKEKFPDVVIYTDIALDPYSSAGHDGVVDTETGVILNDATVHQLCKQAVSQAEAGADVVAPSDMMDGRIGAIREALDDAGFPEVGIMAYTAKYASAFYGPFREALDSNPRAEGKIPKDKKTYQMDPANYREALREIEADAQNGWLDERAAVLEALMSLKRAGADVILTYYALDAARWLKEDAEKIEF